MYDLQAFQNSEFGEISILMIDGKEYFTATNCAKILGYANPQEAIRTHCKGVRKILTPSVGGNQRINYIPEGDLYRLIIRSKLPAAQKFERWVFDEVLPTIRKTGGYGQGTRQEFSLEQMVRFATEVATQVVTQIVPVIATAVKEAIQESRPAAPTIGAAIDTMDFYSRNRCKMETFPTEITEQVDGMLKDMIRQQALNFSHIARYCTLQGHPISSPAVKRYFDRRVEEGI